MDRKELESQWEICSKKMEELMQKLPEMERLNALCAQIEASKQILDKAAELRSYQSEREFNLNQIRKNREEGNAGTAAFIENQMGYHLGLMRAAEKDLNELLEKSDYGTVEEVQAFVSANAPLTELKARVTAFSSEYADTLNKLTELDQLLDGADQS